MNCERCDDAATTRLHTGFGMEHLCEGCRDHVRRDGQEIAAPYPLTLEDFAAWQSWREYIRLTGMGLDTRAALQHRIQQARTGAWVFNADGKRTDWTAMLEGWYAGYLKQRECAA